MLTDPTPALQDAFIATLKQDPDVSSVVGDRVFDRIPNQPDFPYLSIGEIQVIPELGEGTDGVQAFVTVHSWDRFKSATAVRSVGKYAIAALHDRDLMVGGAVVLSVLLESSRTLRDPDGLTMHGVHTFEVLTDAAPSS